MGRGTGLTALAILAPIAAVSIDVFPDHTPVSVSFPHPGPQGTSNRHPQTAGGRTLPPGPLLRFRSASSRRSPSSTLISGQ